MGCPNLGNTLKDVYNKFIVDLKCCVLRVECGEGDGGGDAAFSETKTFASSVGNLCWHWGLNKTS